MKKFICAETTAVKNVWMSDRGIINVMLMGDEVMCIMNVYDISSYLFPRLGINEYTADIFNDLLNGEEIKVVLHGEEEEITIKYMKEYSGIITMSFDLFNRSFYPVIGIDVEYDFETVIENGNDGIILGMVITGDCCNPNPWWVIKSEYKSE